MVKKLYILLIIFIPLTCLKAQLKTGNNPGVLNASAVFEAESTNKGFLIPRMTTAEMNAIASPALGLMVYNTDLNCLHFYFSGWKSQCDPANVGAWSLLGNTGINPATNFLGTTDAQPLIFRTNNTERLRILSGGNIGINLSNPSYKLDIDAQTGSSGDPLRLLGLNVGATTDSLLTSASGVVRRMSFSDYLANANGLTGSGVATRVAFWNGTNSLSSNANLYWDNTNSRLGIGTATPSVQLDVVGRANILTASDFNLFINAGNTTTTGTYNTGIGLSSLGNLTSGSNNVAFVGLGANTTGSYNTAFGGLNANTIGSSNAAFGGGSLLANTIGTHNAAFGTSALEGNIDGTHNTAIGNYALSGVTNGSNNIGLGWGAGDNLTTGSDNIMIGFQIKAPSATGSGQLNIGNLLYGTSLGTGTTPSTGNIGIGTTTPVTKLDVVSSALTTTPTMNVTSTTAGINENIGTNYRNFSGAYFGYIGTAPAGSGGGQGAAIIAGNDKSITFYTGANAGAPGNAWNPTSTENVPRMTILQYTGNVGIGIMAPQYKLDIDARTGSAGNPLRLLGLNAGATSDSLLTSLNGIVRRIHPNQLLSNIWVNGSGTNSAMLPSSSNIASGNRAIVSGFSNEVSGQYSAIIGGTSNLTSGENSVILGGQSLTLSGNNTLGFNGNSTAVNLSQANMFYLGDADLWLGNTTNTARSLRFYEPNSSGSYSGTNYTAFRAQAQGSDITYTLPSADGSSGHVLTTNGSGSLSWTNPSSSGWLLNGNTLTGATTIGSNSAHDVGIETNGTTRLTISSAGAITQNTAQQVTLAGNVDATNGLDVTTAALTANAGSTLTGTTNINATGASATNIGNSGSSVTIAGTTGVTGATTINTSGAGTTSIGTGTSTGTVTVGNTSNTVSIASDDVQMANLPAYTAGNTFLTLNGSNQIERRSFDLNTLAWRITGNSGTVDGINFLGTTDNVPLSFRVNNRNAGRIDNVLNSTFLGYESGLVNTGSNNTFIGNNVGRANLTGELNTFVGSSSGESNTIGTENTAVGHQALENNTIGNDNTAVGQEALRQNIDGISNTGLGESALETNTSGSYNTAVGAEALFLNTDGDDNTAVGESALEGNTIGSSNTAMGREALFSNTSANRNIGIGNGAIYTQSFNNGGAAWNSDNIGIGFQSLYLNQPTNSTNGYRNIAIGTQSLNTNTTGANNLAIGYQAGNTLTTGSNNTLVGYDADVTSNSLTNATAIGNGATVDASNKIRLGNASVTLVETYGSFVTISDKRLKKNITGNNIGLNFIKDLRPVHYELKDAAHKGIIYDGFIAQEIDTILKKYNITFSGLSKPANTEGGYYTVNYATFVVPLVNAVKELDTKMEKVVSENEQLKAELVKIKAEKESLKISVERNTQDIEAIKAMLNKKQN